MQKKRYITLALLLIIGLLIKYPTLCLNAATNGLLLWFNKVLPSLLPFIILINLILPLDGLRFLIPLAHRFTSKFWHLSGYSFFAFIMGLLGSYPMGAKTVRNLYETGKLTESEARLCLCFCNNCGPIFIIATVGSALLGCTELGYFLLGIHILSALLLSFWITRSFSSKGNLTFSKTSEIASNTPSFSAILNIGVANAMETILCIGGYIIFFSVLLALLTQTNLCSMLIHQISGSKTHALWFEGILASLLELSNGTSKLSQIQPTSSLCLSLISAAISFGGLCVYCQTLYVLDHKISAHYYLPAKIFQALISFSLTQILYPFYYMYTAKTSFSALPLNPFILLLNGLLLLLCYLFLPYFYTYFQADESILNQKKEQLHLS